MSLSQEELAILVTGKDVSATKVLRGVSKEADRFSQKLGAIGSKAGRNFARNLERTIVAGAAGAAGAIGYSLKVAGDFEAQLNTINTIARETPEGLAAIGDVIRGLARDTGTPLEELTQGYYDLLSAGIQAADAQDVLTKANTLAIGGLASTAETVDLLTTAINTYGGDASQAGRYADVFAKAVERGKVTAADIASTFAGVGPLAAEMGIEIEEIAAGYARMTAGGTSAGEAQTQMTAALNAFLKKTGPLEALEKQTGKNYAAIAGKKGLAVAYQQLRTDAEKAGVSLGDILGRKEALLYMLQVTGENQAAYNADLLAMTKAEGTAAEQAAERQKGFNYQLQRLKANVQDAAITIGTELLPAFADLAGGAAEFLRGHQPEIKAFAQDLAKGIREAVEWARKLDWDAIARALGTGADAAKTIASVFMAMPTEMKGLLVGGYVANKATGGAVTDLAGLLVKSFAGRGSSPANPLFVSAVGGIGGPGGAGAGGGLLAGGMSIAGLMLIADGLNRLPTAVTTLADVINNPDPRAKVGAAQANLDNAAPWLQGSLFGPLMGPLRDWLGDLERTLTPEDHSQDDIERQRGGAFWDPKRPLRVYGEVEDQRGAVKWDKIAAGTDRSNAKLETLGHKLQENKAAQMAGAERVASAIRAKRLSVRVDVRPVNNISLKWTMTGGRPVMKSYQSNSRATVRVGGAVSADNLW